MDQITLYIISWIVILSIFAIITIHFVRKTKLYGSTKELRQEREELVKNVEDLCQRETTLITNNETKRSELKELEKTVEWTQSQIATLDLLNKSIQQRTQEAQVRYKEKEAEYQKKVQESWDMAEFEAQQKYLALQEVLGQETRQELEDGLKVLREVEDNTKTAQILLDDLKSKIAAARELQIAEERKKDEQRFYQLQLPQSALEDVAVLRSIEGKLHITEAINKVIWKTYYERPYTELVGRVLKGGVHTGIYKITSESGRIYVGQAVDVADRWRQHIKRGLGAEPITQNKLYPAMRAIGPENFRFELIEDCPRDQLNERERYWIDFLGSKEFGYNVTGGNR